MEKSFGTLSFLDIEFKINDDNLMHGLEKINKHWRFSQLQGNLSFKKENRIGFLYVESSKNYLFQRKAFLNRNKRVVIFVL